MTKISVINQLLNQIDSHSPEELFSIVDDELRKIVGGLFRHEYRAIYE